MTIILPEDLTIFRQAFDSSIKRILDSEMDATFYALTVQLIAALRQHSVLKAYVLHLESVTEEQNRAFNEAALEALEDSWKRLWKYHRHNLRHRKKLVHIKRMITAPSMVSYSPLYQRILFSMREFLCHSPFWRIITKFPQLFRSAEMELQLTTHRFKYRYPPEKKYFDLRELVRYKLSKNSKYQHLHKKVYNPKLHKIPIKHVWNVENAKRALFSPKVDLIEKRYSISGQNSTERRQTMQVIAETTPAFCWDRIRFLYRCYTFDGILQPITIFNRPWVTIRNDAWKTAVTRCENEVLFGAQMAFKQKLSNNSASIDCFIACEHQFHRKDFEKFLLAFQQHIHNQLFKLESLKHEASQHPLSNLPGTQKEHFVIDLARLYWNMHPLAIYDEVFKDYSLKCPKGYKLSRQRWEQIIRERKLDPRPPGTKKRRKGKKTS